MTTDLPTSCSGSYDSAMPARIVRGSASPASSFSLRSRCDFGIFSASNTFAVFNSIGTANNLAIRDYLNAQNVPQLWAGDGSQSIGRSFARYPWTMGFLMSYRGEGDVYGKTILRSRPKAKIGVLYENKLGDAARAITAYAKALELPGTAGGERGPMEALDRLLLSAGRWRELVRPEPG